jgi:hypothetical protein
MKQIKKSSIFFLLIIGLLLSTGNSQAQNNGDTPANNPGNFTHYIGELYGGGIIIAIWGKDGNEKGLIASLTDLSAEAEWSNVKDKLSDDGRRLMDGQSNTTEIMNQKGHTQSAAKLCRDYSGGGYNDWYLPSLRELQICFQSAYIVNNVLGYQNGFQFEYYWCSTDLTNVAAYCLQFSEGNPNLGVVFAGGHAGGALKSYKKRVRAVRMF